MESRRRLIENIGDITQAAAEVPDHLEPLCLTAGKRICPAGKAQIPQPHRDHTVQSCNDLPRNRPPQRIVDLIQQWCQIAHLHFAHLADVVSADTRGQRLWIQSAAAAGPAGGAAHKALHLLPHLLAQTGNIPVEIQAVKARHNTLIGQIGFLSGIVIAMLHDQRLVRPAAQGFPLLRRKIAQRLVRRIERIVMVVKFLPASAGKLAEADRSLVDALAHVKHGTFIQLHALSQSCAVRTHLERMIE